MKHVPATKLLILQVLFIFLVNTSQAQACTPAGDQVSFGTGNIWAGYVYTGTNFNTYRGSITAGTAGSYHFDQNFGGSGVNFPTNGCPVYTDNFSVRYKLNKTFTNENIIFTVSGDDGFRLSIDGGATWLINRWVNQSYTTVSATQFMNGNYNLVLEYYESGGDNRITFTTVPNCTGTGVPSVYGTNNTWRGYIYEGMNFGAYKGFITEGSPADANFDEGFGGDNTTISGISCPIPTQNFSARFRLTKNFSAGSYMFTVGGDDGYRFSIDGGNTWLISQWFDHGYNSTTATVTMSGNYNLVIEYYENSGQNRINFAVSSNLVLPVKLTAFQAQVSLENKVKLTWATSMQENLEKFVIQQSTDGISFKAIGETKAALTTSESQQYNFNLQPAVSGTLYFRLAMIDVDGTTAYSPITNVMINSKASGKIYPTVVNNSQLYFDAASAHANALIEVFDRSGRRLHTKTVSLIQGRQEIGSRISARLSTGNYIIRILADQKEIAKQQVVVL